MKDKDTEAMTDTSNEAMRGEMEVMEEEEAGAAMKERTVMEVMVEEAEEAMKE